MIGLYYAPIEIAYIIKGLDLGMRGTMGLINRIYEEDKAYIPQNYLEDKRAFILDVLKWGDYIDNKSQIDAEFPAIERDFMHLGLNVQNIYEQVEYSNMDLFFKNMRIRILFGGGKDYARMKLRTLLSAYGYKRRSNGLVRYFLDNMKNYHIKAYTRGRVECDIGTVGIDEMITFRVM